MPALPLDQPEIVVTASRLPQLQAATPASVTILDHDRIERLGEPLLPALLRHVPSLAVASSGPAGSFTQVRIRGAEANHSLLLIDGIRANDPANGNEPRFELLNTDLASRIEVVRGPQSALWGSEAIGGVIAVDGLAPTVGQTVATQGETGSNGFRRATASGTAGSSRARLALGAGWQRSNGINIVAGPGDRDGYRNLAVRGRGEVAAGGVTVGASGFALRGRSDIDGFFTLEDTRHSNRSRLAAGRLWLAVGSAEDSWSGTLSGSLLGSALVTRDAGAFVSRSQGRRRSLGGQLQHRLRVGSSEQLLIVAAETEKERYRAADAVNFGFADQRRDRRHQALTAEWRGEWGDRLVSDIAIRHDRFSRFNDSTSLRASALAHVASGLDLTLSYGQGIAQPSFLDLYGFFPDSFVGNPSLAPERSRGWEAGLRYSAGAFAASVAVYRQVLRDEIVFVGLPSPAPGIFLSSTANATGGSIRKGVEVEARWTPGPWLRLAGHYAYLAATEPDIAGVQVRETRRPRHSGSVAADGHSGRLTYGASIAYTGERTDADFGPPPAFLPVTVRLGAYWLASARLAYSITPALEVFARVANAFDSRYSDVVGYRSEGRTAYAGVRLALGR